MRERISSVFRQRRQQKCREIRCLRERERDLTGIQRISLCVLAWGRSVFMYARVGGRRPAAENHRIRRNWWWWVVGPHTHTHYLPSYYNKSKDNNDRTRYRYCHSHYLYMHSVLIVVYFHRLCVPSSIFSLSLSLSLNQSINQSINYSLGKYCS